MLCRLLFSYLCRGDLEKQHGFKKTAIKLKSRLDIFVSLNSNSKNLDVFAKLELLKIK